MAEAYWIGGLIHAALPVLMGLALAGFAAIACLVLWRLLAGRMRKRRSMAQHPAADKSARADRRGDTATGQVVPR
jgi:hypothetical protein